MNRDSQCTKYIRESRDIKNQDYLKKNIFNIFKIVKIKDFEALVIFTAEKNQMKSKVRLKIEN